jgi:hypothetical protein
MAFNLHASQIDLDSHVASSFMMVVMVRFKQKKYFAIIGTW